jgi:hypothetical protein
MNAQKGLLVVLGLGALAGVGYAVAASGKDAPAPPPPPPPVDTGPLPTYVPQALVEAYGQCFAMGPACPAITYQQIQAGLAELMRTHPEENPLWTYFSNELARVYGAGTVSSSPNVTANYPDRYSSQSAGIPNLDFSDPQTNPGTQPATLDLGALGGATGVPLTLPLNFPATLAVSYVNCWYTLCSQTEFKTLTDGMIAYMNRTDVNDTDRAQVSLALKSAFNRRISQSGTQGVTGRHTGGCACQARQEEVGTGACCDSCAKGEECEECGNHAPAVG